MQKSCCSSDDQKQWDLVRPSQKRLGTLSMLAVGWIVFDAEAADYISLAPSIPTAIGRRDATLKFLFSYFC
jgi:hypothetical protein